MTIRTPQADLNQGSQQATRVTARTDAGPAKGADKPAASGDTVTLTREAAGLLKLEESLADIPDIDSARVAALKSAIADGSYQADPEKIVDRLLSIEKDIP